MQLHRLKNDELEQSFHRAVKTERKIMHIVLLHVQEVERRELHLARGYSTLKQYLIKVMKYSEPAASRRVEGATLLKQIPEIAEKLETGELNLSQINEIQKAVRSAESLHQQSVSVAAKSEMVDRVANQNLFATQQLCAEMLNIPVVATQVVTEQKDESKRINITLTKRQFEKLEQARDILAEKTFQAKRTQNIPDVLETMCDEIIAAAKPKASAKINLTDKHAPSEKDADARINDEATTRIKPQVSSISVFGTNPTLRKDVKTVLKDETNTTGPKSASVDSMLERPLERSTHRATLCETAPVINSAISETETETETEKNRSQISAPWNSLTPKRKKLILQRDGCCQYRDRQSGNICGSTFQLNVDHITPVFAGGTNEPGNLRALCRSHNLYLYRKACSDIEVC